MSVLKKLFGGGAAEKADTGPAASAEYEGFAIKATPYEDCGQWQMCGVIEKEIHGELRSHRFVRADRFPSREQAAEFTLSKARQIIDQMGERVFA
ncbi:MAG: HlyU family transcriptional regulator [Beijerinckiaceae bacterium]